MVVRSIPATGFARQSLNLNAAYVYDDVMVISHMLPLLVVAPHPRCTRLLPGYHATAARYTPALFAFIGVG